MNLYPVAIVENFYENPDAIRKFALAQEYQFLKDRKNADYVYPGARTKELVDLDKHLYAKIIEKLVSVFHNTDYDTCAGLFRPIFNMSLKNTTLA